MPKQKLFDEDSDEEVTLKTENEYAKKYDAWREKEEIHKLEQKYGSKALNEDGTVSTDSEDESDEPPEISEETEAQFLKTLALLKTKDPRIYDPQYKFFDEEKEKQNAKEPKANKLTFEDSDDDDDDGGAIFSIEKKAEIAEETSKISDTTQKNAPGKDGKIKAYLTGKVEHIDQAAEQDLAPLKALWSDPKLSEGEAFLRDYILNKKYLEEGDVSTSLEQVRDDEDLEADEKLVEEQGKFERAYNFRFEEPDEEYLKRYPRTMNYIRPKDDKRSRKRAEIRTRKEEEKKRKMEEIGRLKALKLKEIQEKIAKIKEVTGNDELAFQDEDIEGDFDPDEHDRRMRAIFDEQYYGEADEQKPVFPDLDEELEIENWDKYDIENSQGDTREDAADPHCEDEDFNMDADYDPKKARENLLEEIQRNLGKKRRNRKKKSKLAELLSQDKPKYVPTVAEQTYSQYMDEYYKMDCEDIVGGDLPTRFKYREVVPNDFGLSIEEILLADDKELTQWVPLKKIVKHRPADVEKSEVKTYAQKAADVSLKKKVLPSLFKDLPDTPEIVVPIEEAAKKKKKKKKKNKQEKHKELDEDINQEMQGEPSEAQENNENHIDNKRTKKKKKDTNFSEDLNGEENEEEVERNNEEIDVDAHQVSKDGSKDDQTNNKRRRKKKKERNIPDEVNEEDNGAGVEGNDNKQISKKTERNTKKRRDTQENTSVLMGKSDPQSTKGGKNKTDFVVEDVQGQTPNKKSTETQIGNNLKRKLNTDHDETPIKKRNKSSKKKNKMDAKMKFKQQNQKQSDDPLNKLSDERLKAYGLNPKKYRGFLKYKKF